MPMTPRGALGRRVPLAAVVRLLLEAPVWAAVRLLLDEPVSGLDPKVTADMYQLIKRLNDEGITIIMISHDIEAAVGFASHILHIGDRIFYGAKQEYLQSDMGGLFTQEGGRADE